MSRKKKIKKEYSWRLGVGHKVKPEIAAKEIERIAEKYGVASPEAVVQEASRRNNPLHDDFDWDDSVGGPKWRLHQARQLCGALIVTIIEEKRPVRETRAFVSVTQNVSEDEETGEVEKQRGYLDVETVLSDDDYRAQVLKEAKNYFVRGRQKYEEIKELGKVFTAIDQFQLKFDEEA